MINLDQKEKTIRTDSFSVKGNLISWENTIIQISNISMISTTANTCPFPLISAVFALVGICLLGYVASLGWILLILGALGLLRWFLKLQKLKSIKNLNFLLNSGGVFTLVFHDKAFLDNVVDVLTDILKTSSRNSYYTFNIKDNRMINCNNNNNNVNCGNTESSVVNNILESQDKH